MTKHTDSSTTPPKVTIIIPVYNGDQYLQRCLDSVYSQTFSDYEIIAINDGSQDKSLAILKDNQQSQNISLNIINQKNHGQGYARNKALKKVRGEYLMFLDADDYIMPSTLEQSIELADKDRSDLVHFGWKLLTPANVYKYPAKDFLSGKKILKGDDCDNFVRMHNFFSVNNLYRVSFLQKNNLVFDEGHIYEDNIFVARVANTATKISLIDDPLYVVQENLRSTTRSRVDTNKHSKDHLRAIQTTFSIVKPRTAHMTFYLAGYHLEKFVVYYQQRVPKRYKKQYLRNFVTTLNQQAIDAPANTTYYRFLRTCLKYDVFTKKRYQLFHMLVVWKISVIPLLAKLRSVPNK